jgi:hypothetical protein
VSDLQEEPVTEQIEFLAVRLSTGMEIRPALVDRAWMKTPAGRFAKRCLPLLIANQSGWELLNPSGFTAGWDGGDELASVNIWPHSETQVPWVISHFGSGILTWHVPYLFRTPSGYNLLVRGPANMPKDGIAPLEGIVETDWTMATFTMNWKFTRPGYLVKFEAGEPIAMVVPMPRGELERFRPVLRDAESAASMLAGFQHFSASRQEFLQALKTPGSSAANAGWQRDYMLGRNLDGTVAPEHQTKVQLAPFETDSSKSVSGLETHLAGQGGSAANIAQSFPDPSSLTSLDALLDLGEQVAEMVRRMVPTEISREERRHD